MVAESEFHHLLDRLREELPERSLLGDEIALELGLCVIRQQPMSHSFFTDYDRGSKL